MRSLQPASRRGGRLWAGCALAAVAASAVLAGVAATAQAAVAAPAVVGRHLGSVAADGGRGRGRRRGETRAGLLVGLPGHQQGPRPDPQPVQLRRRQGRLLHRRSRRDRQPQQAVGRVLHLRRRRGRDDLRGPVAHAARRAEADRHRSVGEVPRRRGRVVDDHPRRQGDHRAVHDQRAVARDPRRPHRRLGRRGGDTQAERRRRARGAELPDRRAARAAGAGRAPRRAAGPVDLDRLQRPVRPVRGRLGHGFLHGRQHRQRAAERRAGGDRHRPVRPGRDRAPAAAADDPAG